MQVQILYVVEDSCPKINIGKFSQKIFANFGLKSSKFEVSSASENEPNMKTKMDLWTKIFKASRIFEASLQQCSVVSNI